MSKYINADTLIDELKDAFDDVLDRVVDELSANTDWQKEIDYWYGKANSYEQTIVKLSNALAESKPVGTGEWCEVIDIGFHGFRCSLCGEDSYRRSNYCSNCGAKMRAME